MSWPDASVIMAIAAGSATVIGAVVGGTVTIVRAIREVDAKAATAVAQNVTAIEQNEEIKKQNDIAISQTNGHLTALRERLTRETARADALQATLTSVLALVEVLKTHQQPTALVVEHERRVRKEDIERNNGGGGGT